MQLVLQLKQKNGLLNYTKSIEIINIQAQKFELNKIQLSKIILKDFDELNHEQKLERLKHILHFSSHQLIQKLYLRLQQLDRNHVFKQYLRQKFRNFKTLEEQKIVSC
eukprot:TRINITY_DN7780_c0_g1_i4.p4 TRINITY_DN7780_c0_g1~~TRINITY_DN7780_c0_g1_i4.p4  ORF type:complete len:108 (-),score=2.75 TRINITY_DN7780_c0_g1_i4:219-542(-)